MSGDDLLGISEMFQEYARMAGGAVEEAIEEYAKKDLLPAVKAKSPVRSKKYRKGWRVAKETTAIGGKLIIHNKNSYSLTHLLENPHLTRSGGMTKPSPHIRPAFDETIDNLENRIKEKLGGI